MTGCHPTAQDARKGAMLCVLLRDEVKKDVGVMAADQIFWGLRPRGKVLIIVKTNLVSLDYIRELANSFKNKVGVVTVGVVFEQT